MNKRLIIGGAIILIAVLLAFSAFKGSLTAYVDYDEARQLNRNCQVMGEIVKEHVNYDLSSGTLQFPITDESGNIMQVSYAGLVPGNFEQASSVVAIGRYRDDRFEANQLLVKCPSKYQGLEEQGEENPHEAKIKTGGA